MLKINELLKATKGKLICGSLNHRIPAISIDSRSIKKDNAFIAIKGNNFDGHDFIREAINKGASCIIAEKLPTPNSQLPTTFIQVKDTSRALGDISRFQRSKFDIPIIAVTGSNGKTTVKEMVACVLSRRFKVLRNEGTKNNHIGLPLTLLKLDSSYDIAVLEIGTNHFGEVEYLAKISLPNIGVITNIGPSHLEFLRDLRGVFQEKYKLIDNLKNPCIVILNADDRLLRRQANKKIQRPFILGFGIKNNCDFSASGIKVSKGKLEFQVNQKHNFSLNTIGYHNVYNALVAIAVGRLFGMEYKDIVSCLANFEFLQGRLKFIKLDDITFIDDTYNSNPLSLVEALNALENFVTRGRKIFVMGDMLELGSRKDMFHYQAGQKAARVCDAFITVGRLSKLAAQSAQASGFDQRNIFSCESCSDARDVLFNKVSPRKDDIVLVKGSRLMNMEEIFKI